MTLYLHQELRPFFLNRSTMFKEIMLLRGQCFREQKNRLTQLIQLGNKDYFIKQHQGVGWREIFKNLFQLRLPVLGASNEWLAILKLQSLNIAVPEIFGFGQKGMNPARQASFIILENLKDTVSLEDVCRDWLINPPTFKYKQKILNEVARIAATLHKHNINHRDFYLCHFLMKTGLSDIKIYLIDLHRAQLRQKPILRWIIKDLAGLYFSSKEIGLTKRDYYRFMKAYTGKPLRQILSPNNHFWQKVASRGEQLFRNHQ